MGSARRGPRALGPLLLFTANMEHETKTTKEGGDNFIEVWRGETRPGQISEAFVLRQSHRLVVQALLKTRSAPRNGCCCCCCCSLLLPRRRRTLRLTRRVHRSHPALDGG